MLVCQEQNLRVRGDLTAATARALFAQTPAFAARDYTLDLAEVGEVDAAGLALVLHWSNLVAAGAGKLQLQNAPEKLERLSALYSLADFQSP